MKTHYDVFSKLKNRDKGINMLVTQFNLKSVTCETLFNNFAYKQEIKKVKKKKESEKAFQERFYGDNPLPDYLDLRINSEYLIPDKINILEKNKIELIFKSKV